MEREYEFVQIDNKVQILYDGEVICEGRIEDRGDFKLIVNILNT